MLKSLTFAFMRVTRSSGLPRSIFVSSHAAVARLSLGVMFTVAIQLLFRAAITVAKCTTASVSIAVASWEETHEITEIEYHFFM